jgi:hypothetical protein
MELCRKQTSLSEGTTCTLVYFITIDDLTDNAAGIQLETYGVGISICEHGETAFVPNVTLNLTAILQLSALLVDHLVTPSTVRDIVEDWLND